MSTNWQEFWDGYRRIDAHSDDDLFVQVGKTVASRPIPREMFALMLERIAERLALAPTDELLDLCCGNGLVTRELASRVAHVTGVDFARHLIDAAQALKSAPNVEYRVGDVAGPLHHITSRVPDKILMNDALAYFDPETLGALLDHLAGHVGGRPFRFLVTGVPDASRLWNFYDTAERKHRYLQNVAAGDVANDGLGRWWNSGEIEALCTARALQCRFEEQPDAISNYRMDALIWRD